MTAVEIIDEIKHLPPAEQARVALFLRELEAERAWTPEELSTAAGRLAREDDPARAEELSKRIVAGLGAADA